MGEPRRYQAGDQLDTVTHEPLTRTDIVRYAGASGDFNPIHHDEGFATAAGFPTVFSIGMYQAGLLANYVADQLGPENLRRISLRFSNQVWPGDVLTFDGTISAVSVTPDGDRVEVDLTCRRTGTDGTEGIGITATAAFLVV
jgi:acyl dehydratase